MPSGLSCLTWKAISAPSRLCIKNVPKHVNEIRLKKHFGSQGQVTDVKLLRTKKGESRQIAFIGYYSAEEASSAAAFFNKSYLDTSRLVVEAAVSQNDESLPRPWSRFSQISLHSQKTEAEDMNASTRIGKKRQRLPSGPRANDVHDSEANKQHKKKQTLDREEYLATMMPRSRARFWANDDALAGNLQYTANDSEKGLGAGSLEGRTKKQKQADREVPQNYAISTVTEGDGIETCEVEDRDAQELEDTQNKNADDDSEEATDEEVGIQMSSPAKARPGCSDLLWLRSKVKEGLDGSSEARDCVGGKQEGPQREEDGAEDREVQAPVNVSYKGNWEAEGGGPEQEEQAGTDEEESGSLDGEPEDRAEKHAGVQGEVAELGNGRLFLRNLTFTLKEEELVELLSPFGQVAEVHLAVDEVKRPKGFAFATFLVPEDAHKAQIALDGKSFQGRLLHILPARDRPRDPLADLDPAKARTYKERKEIERRKRAGEETGWNASIMRSETVVDAVADRLKVEKGAVLDKETTGMAVKLALGETFLLAENREFFQKEGIDLSVLEGSKDNGMGRRQARSKTMILVKNLPYTTSQDDLHKLFDRFGNTARILLPPSRAIALVEFLEASEARRAFTSLAYRRFHHVPLYLEWAPLAMLSDEPESTLASSQDPNAQHVNDVATHDTQQAIPAASPYAALSPPLEAEKEDAEGSHTIFVKNLNFATTEEGLSVCFRPRTEGLRAVSIPRKSAPQKAQDRHKKDDREQESLSMGYGFVEYGTTAQANAAKSIMNGMMLDGHRLECKLSHKRLSAQSESPPKMASKKTKIIIRNVAFQATLKELKELLGTFGKLKSVRLPRRFSGQHRGFAFAEFLTSHEAIAAFEALQNTHLYGRHLVMEWAEDRMNVESLREKARREVRRGAERLLDVEASEGKEKKRKKTRKEGGDMMDVD